MDKWRHDCRDTLMNWAVSLDKTIGDVEDAVHLWWSERFTTWPNPDQPMTGRPVVERAIDPAERERIERTRRFAAMLTRGRWQ
jgi:hypothetical protein